MNQNQNQRYEVLMHFPGYKAYKGFTGYECRMAFPGASTPQNLASEGMDMRVLLTRVEFSEVRAVACGTGVAVPVSGISGKIGFAAATEPFHQ